MALMAGGERPDDPSPPRAGIRNPAANGRKSRASIGSVRVAASRMRRMTRPQTPPVWNWSMFSTSDPSAMPRKKQYAHRYERKKWPGVTSQPRAHSISPTAPAITAGRW